MQNTVSMIPESNQIKPQDDIHSTQPVVLSHEQEIRVNSASEDLTGLIASTKHAPITGDLYKGYADMKNPIRSIPSSQYLLQSLSIIRNKEKVLQFLNPEQKSLLKEINTYFIPLLLPIIAEEENGRNKQELILDVLSLE